MRKAIKKAISLLLVAVMVFGSAPLAGLVGLELSVLDETLKLNAYAWEIDSDGYYYLDSYYCDVDVTDGTVVIVEFYEDDANVIIPPIISGYSVVGIGPSAFAHNSSLMSVVIPYGVTGIGCYAFSECENLTYIIIPDSITGIDYFAFRGCSNLKDIYYTGSEEEWNAIQLGDGPSDYDPFVGATIHYNHSHNYSSVVTKKPTCTEKGTRAYTCVCGSYTVEISKLGHNIVIDKAVAPTCTSTGLTAGQHCSRCDDMTVEQEVVPVLGHDIVIDEAVASTCTETGLTEGQHCSRCDDVTVEQNVVPVKPHNPTEKYDSSKHWKECVCGLKTDEQNHSFISGNICSCGYKKVTNATLSIKNNTGSKTINYGETLKLTAIVTNRPADAKVYWYVDGVLMDEGEILNVNFESGTKIITVKLVDLNGNVIQDADGNEICDSETISINSSIWQRIVSFFKNLFGLNRTVVQAIFKGIY